MTRFEFDEKINQQFTDFCTNMHKESSYTIFDSAYIIVLNGMLTEYLRDYSNEGPVSALYDGSYNINVDTLLEDLVKFAELFWCGSIRGGYDEIENMLVHFVAQCD